MHQESNRGEFVLSVLPAVEIELISVRFLFGVTPIQRSHASASANRKLFSGRAVETFLSHTFAFLASAPPPQSLSVAISFPDFPPV